MEDAVDVVLRDAGAVVADDHLDGVLADGAGANGQRAVPIHRLDRVVDDVGPYLIEIAWITLDFRQGHVPFLH